MEDNPNVETLYDWLMQVKGMREDIALDIDDRIPEIDAIPTPQTLWQYAGIQAHADSRSAEPDDPALLMALYDFVDGLCDMIAAGDDAGSVYAEVYKDQERRSRAKVAEDGRFRTERARALAVHARARRTAAQVFLGHVWEVCYRLDVNAEPVIRFGRPIAPEVPFPAVPVHV